MSIKFENIDYWWISDVILWLKTLKIKNIEEIIKIFKENDVDGFVLKRLEKIDMFNMGLKSYGKIIKIIHFRDVLINNNSLKINENIFQKNPLSERKNYSDEQYNIKINNNNNKSYLKKFKPIM